MTKKNAVALRLTKHAEETFDEGVVILGMDRGQFNDWKSAGLVREATAEEAEAAKVAAEPASEPDSKPAGKTKAAATA